MRCDRVRDANPSFQRLNASFARVSELAARRVGQGIREHDDQRRSCYEKAANVRQRYNAVGSKIILQATFQD